MVRLYRRCLDNAEDNGYGCHLVMIANFVVGWLIHFRQLLE